MVEEYSETTKRIAKSLGCVETISLIHDFTTRDRRSTNRVVTVFDYLIVVDFESTCWRERLAGRQPEIIEFPAVLMNTTTGTIEEEFHQYVSPTENRSLSAFCMQFTGISQNTVDNGILLKNCLQLFMKWVDKIAGERKLAFHEVVPGKKSCTFVTWSDWDFGVCLHNECTRKNIQKPSIFCKWIDLKSLYKDHFKRTPRGLRGALSDMGLSFEGREHSGICDARNTASLAWHMIKHGTELKITGNKKPQKLKI